MGVEILSKYKILLFDLDDTILDFGAAEGESLTQVLHHQGVKPKPELYKRYRMINQQHWEMLERNELTKEKVLTRRHEIFFDELGIKVDGSIVDEMYRTQIGEHGHKLADGAHKTIKHLSEYYRMYIITNGLKQTQEKRLRNSGILPYFNGVFISEDTGYQKPMKAFFDYVTGRIEDFTNESALIIGDSLTSDILGGINSNIDTCWYNPEDRANPYNFEPDYEIRQLNDITHILDR